MRRALIPALLVLGGIVIGATVAREPVAAAAGRAAHVFVSNTKRNPVPVRPVGGDLKVHEQGTAATREQNLDAGGNVKVHEQGTANVHEQGTANVKVTNALSIAQQPPVTSGGGSIGMSTNTSGGGAGSATALSIRFTLGSSTYSALQLFYQGNMVTTLDGPPVGNDSIVLPLTRPIQWDTLKCLGSNLSGRCDISWVGAKP